MKHEFVDFIPETIVPDTLYISLEYGTVVHLCACGCGNEVVTPISPAEWSITYDGRAISLWPSVGNWSYPCQSHYIIWKGRIEWARKWSKAEIAAVRDKDFRAKLRFLDADAQVRDDAPQVRPAGRAEGLVARLIKWIFG